MNQYERRYAEYIQSLSAEANAVALLTKLGYTLIKPTKHEEET